MVVEAALKCMNEALQKLDSVGATAPAAHLAVAIDSLREYISARDQAGNTRSEISQMADEVSAE